MKWLAALISCCVIWSVPAFSREIRPAERGEVPYDGALPACGDEMVLQDISWDFSKKESRFWDSDLKLVNFEQVRQVAWRPWGLDHIPRRYCTGLVITSDGHRRKINFSIREDLGFIGLGWDTDFCVDGLDRNYAYAPHCRQAAP